MYSYLVANCSTLANICFGNTASIIMRGNSDSSAFLLNFCCTGASEPLVRTSWYVLVGKAGFTRATGSNKLVCVGR